MLNNIAIKSPLPRLVAKEPVPEGRKDVLMLRHPSRLDAGKDPLIVQVHGEFAPWPLPVEVHRNAPSRLLYQARQTGRLG